MYPYWLTRPALWIQPQDDYAWSILLYYVLLFEKSSQMGPKGWDSIGIVKCIYKGVGAACRAGRASQLPLLQQRPPVSRPAGRQHGQLSNGVWWPAGDLAFD